MTVQRVESFLAGEWVRPGAGARAIESAVTGEVIAEVGGAMLDAGAMLDFAHTGGAALRAMTFHQRAAMLKALAMYLTERKPALYEASFATGATQSDHLFDIDGGIGTLFVFASKGRREMPDDHIFLDGGLERFGREGRFLGQHVCTSLQGVAVHINAFNFPVWGMLEKLAPAFLGGVPAIVKPATATCYVTELAARMMLESGLLPEGALQFVAGGLGDLLDHLGAQDVVGFTGSAATARMLRGHDVLLDNSVRFMAEQDSLNASILGPDVGSDSAEFDLFVKEIVREMTVKAGQKCTAIRRIIAPEMMVQPVIDAVSARLSKTVIGDPRAAETRMGALVSAAQKRDVLEKAALIASEAERVFGTDDLPMGGQGGFVSPMLFHCADPDAAQRVHDTEAFGPVSTVMGYRDLDHAVALANRGGGSLAISLFSNDADFAAQTAVGIAPSHGRLMVVDESVGKNHTGHQYALAHCVHGGPGRAGDGEELGGLRGLRFYMQRSAVQGSPALLERLAGNAAPACL